MVQLNVFLHALYTAHTLAFHAEVMRLQCARDWLRVTEGCNLHHASWGHHATGATFPSHIVTYLRACKAMNDCMHLL